jgi:3',5'-cyclic-AMP phosphodiesterase
MKRRQFLQKASLGALVLGASGVQAATNWDFMQKPILRFAVASDGHYGQKNTEYEAFFRTLVEQVNLQHTTRPLDACVINGDIIHDEKPLLQAAKMALDGLKMPYFVTQGNHDMVSPAEWKAVWGQEVNQAVEFKKSVFLLGTTSNEKGEYLSPNVEWFRDQLERYENKQNIFIFVHITPLKWTANGVDAQEFQQLMVNYPNIRAVFNGHDHDQAGIRWQGRVPYLFDSHFGGAWGTTYRGFRMVELRKDQSILTYLLDPKVVISEELINR